MAITLNGSTGITTPGVTNSGAETIATTLAVTGAATLSSTLAVTGAATLSSTLAVTGNVTLGSSLLATPSGSAPSYTCRAWVNFNGTGTVAIRASGNVSSITDNTTGNYTVNLTTAMPDTNYAVVASANGQGSTQVAAMPMTSAFAPSAPSTSAFRVFTAHYSAAIDCEYIHATVFQ